MELQIKETGDGSKTLYRPDIDESYHSTHGALAESRHVFIKEGLVFQSQTTNEIKILEVGFGTGLNALLTLAYCFKNPAIKVQYVGLEPFPPSWEMLSQLDYLQLFENDVQPYFEKLHHLAWEESHTVLPNFIFIKTQQKLENFNWEEDFFNVIYFDAFAPRKQEEMWEVTQMEKCFNLSDSNASLVTYCAMGQFRRNLKEAGYTVSKIPGPPGKREMTRAIKSTLEAKS